MGNNTPSHTPKPQQKTALKSNEPLHQEPEAMSKMKALPKPNQPKQPQVYKDPKQHPIHKTTAKVNQRWVPKALLQAQGFYKGKASIWLPKQGQKHIHKPQQQAQQTLPKRLDKPQ